MAQPLPLDVATLLAQEPFVRALSRHLLDDQTDDLVQETWLRALTHGTRAIRDPRRWLGRVARNLASNLRRSVARRHQHEPVAAQSEAVPSSLELLAREERRRALVGAVDELPPPLRAVILLRYFEGRPPRVIAVDLGVPVATIWDRLDRARALLRARLDREHGDRKAWLLPLALPRASTATGTLATAWTGVLLMMAKAKAAVVAAVVLCAALALWWLAGGPPVTPDAGPGAVVLHDGVKAAPARRPDGMEPAAPTTREALASAPAMATGPATLVVHAVRAQDRAPVAGAPLSIRPAGEDPWVATRHARTDAQGVARFTGLAPGRVVVRSDLDAGSKAVTLAAGQVAEIELRWRDGLTLRGIVVDAAGAPVAGAEVWWATPASSDLPATWAATTGDDGRFALPGCFEICLVGARATGHAPSRMQFVMDQPGHGREVRIELPGLGGDVAGVVLGPDGRPVGDALVWIGAGRVVGILTTADGTEALPAQARTDAEGRFRAVGLRAGEHAVVARAAGLAPWSGTVAVTAGGVADLTVHLAAGVTLTGTVTRGDGTALAGVRLTVGNAEELAAFRTTSTGDGRFRLTGLPAGELTLAAVHDTEGRTTRTLRGAPGATLTCDLQLSVGLVLRGRVVDAVGAPAPQVWVEAVAAASADQPRFAGSAQADGAGRFAIDNCPDGRLLRVTTHNNQVVRRGVDPRAGELLLRLPPAVARTARVVGTFVLPDGKPAVGLPVMGGGIVPTDANGHVELGPLAPGPVRVEVDVKTCALWRRERELRAGETWDLGTVRLSRGGTVHAVFQGATGKVSGSVHDQGGQWLANLDPATGRSPALEPGQHVVRVAGPETAASLVPVEVREGEETLVEVACQPGRVQRFAFTAAAGWDDVWNLEVEIAGANGALARRSVWVGDDGRPSLEYRLLPGRYAVTVTAAGHTGDAEFTVADGENPTVTVELKK